MLKTCLKHVSIDLKHVGNMSQTCLYALKHVENMFEICFYDLKLVENVFETCFHWFETCWKYVWNMF